jgi:putative methyltransferase (TIGR04325 family)
MLERLKSLWAKRAAAGPVSFDALVETWPEQVGPSPFDSQEWIESVEDYFARDRAAAARGRQVLEHYVVPTCVAAAVVFHDRRSLRLLDFGGGLGVHAVPVLQQFAREADVRYDIVDSAANCARGRDVFTGDARCRFFDALPAGPYDVVYSSSTLQYIRDWQAALGRLAAYGARFFSLNRFPVTDRASFIARQQIAFASGPHAGKSAGSAPHRFFNEEEVVDLLRGRGYRCIYDHYISDYGLLLGTLRPAGQSCVLKAKLFARADAWASATPPLSEL